MYRLVAMDLDDTLLEPDKTITKEATDLLRRLHDRGVHIAISSGRITQTQRFYASMFADRISYVSYNGSVVVFEDGTAVEYEIPVERIREIAGYCRRKGLYMLIYHEGTVYVEQDAPGLRSDIDTINARSVAVVDFLESDLFSTPKIAMLAHPDVAGGLTDELASMYPEMVVTRSSEMVIEVMPKGVDKAHGLSLVCENLGITKEDAVVFGDNYNDMTMVEWAGLGVAVANAVDALKAVADRVATMERSLGIVEVLRDIFSDLLEKEPSV